MKTAKTTMNVLKTSFSRNLRGYLSVARRVSALSVARLNHATKALPSDPVEPIDAVFSNIPEDSGVALSSEGFSSLNQGVLANTVVENLLHLQNEIANWDDTAAQEFEGLNAKVARAYQHTQEIPSEADQSVYG